ncbi:MAG: lamin tail domain-containing protein [Deltaproteobacteria bacterium]|nr:lamin tail domain-containing protein [Deltaproteobacteria bacterium]
MKHPAVYLALASLGFLFTTGCAAPDLGDAPFLCNRGTPECPDGYACVPSGGKRICLREGLALPGADARSAADAGPLGASDAAPSSDTQPPPLPADAGLPADRGTVKKPDAQAPKADSQPPVGGNLQISEFMANPKAVPDADGEFVELYNPGSAAVDITGWTLKDLGSDLHVVKGSGPVLVPAYGYLVLGREANQTLNGGINVGYVYANFDLANASDEIVLLDKSGKVVDQVSYNTINGFVIPDGKSLSVKAGALDHSRGANWCSEPALWTGSKGDYGTPGRARSCN